MQHAAGDAPRSPAAGRVIVQLHLDEPAPEPVLRERAAALAAAVGADVVRVSRRGRAVLRVARDADVAAAAQRLSGEAGVDYAEPDSTDRAV